MAVFRCKMCGGTLEIKDGMSVATCEYCGSKQTIPKLSSLERANMYDRANHFRRNNEYDKAMSLYESILNEDPTDAEAYWSIVLCRYGVEYVEDAQSHKRIPTVNRAQFTSIFMDEDYKAAVANADGYQREVYEQEAEKIDRIQKGILAISREEKPFDVFICYKETDKDGRRTQDSVLAAELYHELTEVGYNVFFSRITLESKLGTDYEPYIFAALNSAKVMVVIGTKPEYFNAVWVKNEWSRYLMLIKNDRKKMLIPAFRDMDPYDLPEEFSHLQAQDMSKLGFMPDLIRGIQKILGEPEKVNENNKDEAGGGNVSVQATPLLKRAYLFMEDKEWDKAYSYCERVLDAEPENAQAYVAKLLIDLRMTNEEDLEKSDTPISDNLNYKKAVRFGDEALKQRLEGYNSTIIERNEDNRKESIYTPAKELFEKTSDRDKLIKLSERFKEISGYKDSDALAQECIAKGNENLYKKAGKIMQTAAGSSDMYAAAIMYKKIAGYKDSDILAQRCDEKAEEYRKEETYLMALKKSQSNDIEVIKKAITEFSSLAGYKDSDAMIDKCEQKCEDVRKEQVYENAMSKSVMRDRYNMRTAIELYESIPGYKDADKKKVLCKRKLIFITVLKYTTGIIAGLAVILFLGNQIYTELMDPIYKVEAEKKAILEAESYSRVDFAGYSWKVENDAENGMVYLYDTSNSIVSVDNIAYKFSKYEAAMIRTNSTANMAKYKFQYMYFEEVFSPYIAFSYEQLSTPFEFKDVFVSEEKLRLNQCQLIDNEREIYDLMILRHMFQNWVYEKNLILYLDSKNIKINNYYGDTLDEAKNTIDLFGIQSRAFSLEYYDNRMNPLVSKIKWEGYADKDSKSEILEDISTYLNSQLLESYQAVSREEYIVYPVEVFNNELHKRLVVIGYKPEENVSESDSDSDVKVADFYISYMDISEYYSLIQE